MITAEQAMRLLIESNPIPDVSMLHLEGSPPPTRLEDLETRSSNMTALKSPSRPTIQKPRRTVAVVSTAAAVAAVLAILVLSRPPSRTAVAAPVEVARQVATAYGDRDFARAATYLAVGIDPAIVTNPDIDPLFDRFLDVTGSARIVQQCREVGQSADGTLVRCDYVMHDFKSDQIGRGPFGEGSYYEVSVQAGEVVSFADHPRSDPAPEGFSTQMWEPFAAWIGENHPEAKEIMYDPYPTGWRITDESIPLWDKYLTEWISSLQQGS